MQPRPMDSRCSDPLESPVLNLVRFTFDHEDVSDRRPADGLAVHLHDGAGIGRRRPVPHHAERPVQRIPAIPRPHLNGRRSLVLVLPVPPCHVGPLLKNVIPRLVGRMLAVVDFNDHGLNGSCVV